MSDFTVRTDALGTWHDFPDGSSSLVEKAAFFDEARGPADVEPPTALPYFDLIDTETGAVVRVTVSGGHLDTGELT